MVYYNTKLLNLFIVFSLQYQQKTSNLFRDRVTRQSMLIILFEIINCEDKLTNDLKYSTKIFY